MNANAPMLHMTSAPAAEQPSFPAAASAGGSPPSPPDPPKPPGQERREIVLPSGTKAQVLVNGKGKHLRQASRMAGPGTDQMTFSMAMCAVKALIEGQPITLEDLYEMSDEDVLSLIGDVMGGKAKGT